MNERILQLAEQAIGTSRMMSPIENSIPIWTEKFAELIVAECINEVEGLQVSDWNQNWNQAIAHTVLHLKEHFGVEE